MKKYSIVYIDENGNNGEVFIEAENMRYAIFTFEKRYSDVEILTCQKIKSN